MSDKSQLTNYTIEWMKKHRVPLTKENYVHIDSLGQISADELDGEAEADLPREIQAAELRAKRKVEQAIRRADCELMRQMGISMEDSK
jgi:hypothetical protein